VPPSGFDGVWKRNGNTAALLFVMTRLNQSRATSAVSNRPTSSPVLRRIRREWSVSRRNVRVWDELDGYLGPLTKAPAQSGEMRLHCSSIARYSYFSRKGISPKSEQVRSVTEKISCDGVLIGLLSRPGCGMRM
jgi:hypothetical protein